MAKNARNSRFGIGTGVFSCRVCARKTRETGDGCGDICHECFELAGIENALTDAPKEWPENPEEEKKAVWARYRPEVDQHIASLEAKGVDAKKVWEDLLGYKTLFAAPKPAKTDDERLRDVIFGEPIVKDEAYWQAKAAEGRAAMAPEPSVAKKLLQAEREIKLSEYRHAISRATAQINATLANLADHGRVSTHDGFNLGSTASDLQALAAVIESLDKCIGSCQ